MSKDIKKYLPENIKDLPLFEKVQDLVKDVLEEEEKEFHDVFNKYRDFSKVDRRAILATIKELGYDYITDAFNLTDEELIVFINYLNLIHFLKGSKAGLELVFRLMNLNFTLEEWWEKTPIKGEVDTFELTINLNLSQLVPDYITKIKKFIRSYVYPQVLLSFEYSALIDERKTHFYGFSDKTYVDSINYLGVGWVKMTGLYDKSVSGIIT